MEDALYSQFSQDAYEDVKPVSWKERWKQLRECFEEAAPDDERGRVRDLRSLSGEELIWVVQDAYGVSAMDELPSCVRVRSSIGYPIGSKAIWQAIAFQDLVCERVKKGRRYIAEGDVLQYCSAIFDLTRDVNPECDVARWLDGLTDLGLIWRTTSRSEFWITGRWTASDAKLMEQVHEWGSGTLEAEALNLKWQAGEDVARVSEAVKLYGECAGIEGTWDYLLDEARRRSRDPAESMDLALRRTYSRHPSRSMVLFFCFLLEAGLIQWAGSSKAGA